MSPAPGRDPRAAGIVAAGDRAHAAARATVVRRDPPREISTWSVVRALFARNDLVRMTAILGAVGVVFTAGGLWIAGAVVLAVDAALAVAAWRRVARARRLLDSGMAGEARVTRVGLGRWPQSGHRAHVVVDYAWKAAGATGNASASGSVGAGERAPTVGSILEIAFDPTAPHDHVVVRFVGFAFEGGPESRP